MMTVRKLVSPLTVLFQIFPVCCFFLFSQAGGAEDEQVTPPPVITIPDTGNWHIRLDRIFKEDSIPANAYVSDLLKKLSAETGPGSPVTYDEFIQLLLKIEDDQVYTSQLIKYATPLSKKIQDDAHASYASRLMKPEKITAGVAFLREHWQLFEAAKTRYRIEPKDILGILMWESALGKYTGNYRIFNVFMGQILFLEQAEEVALHQLRTASDTLALTFQNQDARLNRLRQNAVKNVSVLLRMTKEKGTNPFSQLGSWGGAIGYVQFMPASLRFAIDGNADGEINLTSWPDAIHSVANYLRQANYRNDRRGRRRAIFAYNRLDSYVNGVIEYADAAWKQFEQEGGLNASIPDSTSNLLDSSTK